MAITLESHARGHSDNTTTDTTANAPSGLADGDFLFAFAFSDSATKNWTGPAGWTEIFDVKISTVTIAAFWKVASSEPSSWTWTYGQTKAAEVWVGRFSGVDTADPIDSSSTNNSSTEDRSPVASSVSLTSTGRFVLTGFVADDNDTTSSPSAPTGTGTWTLVYAEDNPSGGFVGPGNGVAYQLFSGGGSSGDATWTNVLDSAEGWAAAQVALNPSGSAVPVIGLNAVGSLGARSTNTHFGRVGVNVTSLLAENSGGGAPEVGFYVDATGGNDSNDGQSPANAWQTVGKVLATSFSAGDKIFFKGGEIFRRAGQEFVIRANDSGASGNPITYSSYGTGDPIFMGSVDGTVAGNWTQPGSFSGTNIYRSPSLYFNGGDTMKYGALYTTNTPTTFNDYKMTITGLELGNDRVSKGDWVLQSGNVWRFNKGWVQADTWSPQDLLLDGVLYASSKKTTISGITSLGDWGLISNTFYIYSTSDPDTNYDSIAFSRLRQNGDNMTYHDGSNRYHVLYDDRGNPASQYSYLEIPDNLRVFTDNGNDWIKLENLDLRHGSEALFIGFNGGNWELSGIRIFGASRNGILCRPTSASGGTTGDDITTEGSGTSWQKDVEGRNGDPGDKARNGHGVLFDSSGSHTWTNVVARYNAEDGIQTGPGYTGTITIGPDFEFTNNEEDGLDQKGGTVITDHGGKVGHAKGDQQSRHCYLHHQNAGNLTVKNAILRVENSGDVLSSSQGGKTITVERVFFDNSNNDSGKDSIQITAGSDLTISSSAIWQGGINRGVRITGASTITSTHNTYYQNSTSGANELILVNNSSAKWVAKNDVYAAFKTLVDFAQNPAAGTQFSGCLFHRFDGNTSSYLQNGTNTWGETDLDDGLVDSSVTVDSDVKTEDPDFVDKDNEDLSIRTGAGAATGGVTGSGVTVDINNRLFSTTDPPMGAYSPIGTSVGISITSKMGANATPVHRGKASIKLAAVVDAVGSGFAGGVPVRQEAAAVTISAILAANGIRRGKRTDGSALIAAKLMLRETGSQKKSQVAAILLSSTLSASAVQRGKDLSAPWHKGKRKAKGHHKRERVERGYHKGTRRDQEWHTF